VDSSLESLAGREAVRTRVAAGDAGVVARESGIVAGAWVVVAAESVVRAVESGAATLSDSAADVPTSPPVEAMAGEAVVSFTGLPTTYREPESETARKAGATTTVGG
jgi:hypothetical protein